MAEGTVKWFNPEKATASSLRRMAKTSSCISLRSRWTGFKTLDEGAAVQFDVTTGQNGKLRQAT